MHWWLRSISCLMALVVAGDGWLTAHSHHHHHNCHEPTAVDVEHSCCDGHHAEDEANHESHPTLPLSDDDCAACRYLAQCACQNVDPAPPVATDRVERFVLPVVVPVEIEFQRVQHSRGPPVLS